ncbi:hypothetical protein BDY17DRAFT_33815 [Neohortaea acidophila]|uniref:DUF7918 domain-containing protein n=1 Tax=Neohortaea acidophila TaxID=245834 RepID=A0A6A6PJL7_9PEZI|nr:uncharacterized protein BDY17DRAFT_33815 [Neohortaea acidophila]KAF2480192.1 hypothetical protein BDY17DRAFT_33815 [Neohortaea acidophila]
MAISDDIPGVDVAIVVNGKPLQEHKDSILVEEERTVTRYIEAVSGQSFEVRMTTNRQTRFKGDSLAFTIFMDGKEAESALMSKEACRSRRAVRTMKGAEIATGFVKKFFFSALETAADGRKFNDEGAKLSDLGQIVIEVSHVNCVGSPSSGDGFDGETQDIGILSEKAIKGQTLSHSVGLRDAVRDRSVTFTYRETEDVQGIPAPVARFVFHYRSKAALKSMMIIPRTPSPQPVEKRDASTYTPADIEQLRKELREMKEARDAAVKVKQEHADDNPRPRKIARPRAGDTQLELDDDGGLRESSTATLQAPEIIVLD